MDEEQKETPIDIYEAMRRVVRDLGCIAKDQFNKFDKYSFRGIDDVFLALKPILIEHGLLITPIDVADQIFSEMTTSQGSTMQLVRMKIAYEFQAPDKSSRVIYVWAEGADRGDKSLSKAYSAGYKTAIFQAFCVPTDQPADSEVDSPDLDAKPRKRTRKKQEPPPQELPMPPDGDMSGPQEPSTALPQEGRKVFDAKIGFGKFADQTWRWLSEGASGGGRYGWATALRNNIESSPPDAWPAADRINHERLTKVLKIIDDREMSEGAG